MREKSLLSLLFPIVARHKLQDLVSVNDSQNAGGVRSGSTFSNPVKDLVRFLISYDQKTFMSLRRRF
jgi:hypothetical protein